MLAPEVAISNTVALIGLCAWFENHESRVTPDPVLLVLAARLWSRTDTAAASAAAAAAAATAAVTGFILCAHCVQW